MIDRDPKSPTLLLLKTDALVEHIHFLPDTPPRAVGWKAAARVVSDFAAMGGRPEYFLVTLALFQQIPLTLGVLGHEGSTLVVVLNSLRLLFFGGVEKTPSS